MTDASAVLAIVALPLVVAAGLTSVAWGYGMFTLAFVGGFILIMVLLSLVTPKQSTVWTDYQTAEYSRWVRVNGRYVKVED